jgi:hypothetical protein
MQLKRGLIRLWIALSLLWVGMVSYIAINENIGSLEEASTRIEGLKSGRIHENGWEDAPEPKNSEPLSANATVDTTVAKSLAVARAEAKRDEVLKRVGSGFLLIGLLPPLLLLALGFIAAWVIAGFRSDPKT